MSRPEKPLADSPSRAPGSDVIPEGAPSEAWRNAPWVRRVARHIARDDAEADDLLQELWVAVHGAGRAGALRTRPWFARVLLNLARNRWRGERRRRARERVWAAHGGVAPSPEVALIGRERAEGLRVALARLSEQQRTVVVLCGLERLPAVVVAQRLGVPAATVRSRLKRGIDRLRRDEALRRRAHGSGLLATLARMWERADRPRRGRPWSVSRASAFGAGALVLGGALLLVSRGGVSPERPQGPPVALRSVALPTRVVTRPPARLVESGLPIALDAPAVRVASPPVPRDALRVPGGPTREFHLRVIGADTGDDLDGVVVHALSRAGRGVRHPGLRDQAPVVARGDSPLLVESDDLDSAWTLPSGRRILLVGAPGYAWSRVPIAHDASGRRQVSLRRQARLAVELRGTLGAVGLELVLRDDTAGEFVFRHPLAADDVGRRFVFDGLPEGSAFTLGVVAPFREEVRVLTSVAVTLDRGRVAEQSLVVHAPWRESAARVEGRLTAPFVEGTELAVTLESRAPSRGLAARRALVAEVQEIERAEAGVTATWSVDSAPPGAYVATVEPFGAMFAIEALPGDTQRLHLDVPRLAELAVTARDEVSGQVFVPQVLQWQALSAELWKRTAERAFVADADELRSALHVAPGRLRLQVLSTRGVDGYSHLVGEAVITARPGPQQVEVAVRPVHSLHLSFADAGEAVPFLWPDVLHLDAPPGSGRLNLRWLGTHSLVLFETPGSYRFRVEAPVGYEGVPQFEINLTPGRNRREVPLVRS